MGNNGSRSVEYDVTKDKCAPMLQTYVNCVEGKSRGLKEGDECIDESTIYKQCRAAEKQEIQKQIQKSLKEQAEVALRSKKAFQEAEQAFQSAEQKGKVKLQEAQNAIRNAEQRAEEVLDDVKRKLNK